MKTALLTNNCTALFVWWWENADSKLLFLFSAINTTLSASIRFDVCHFSDLIAIKTRGHSNDKKGCQATPWISKKHPIHVFAQIEICVCHVMKNYNAPYEQR